MTKANFPWPSPAKLNLFLHINQRRLDGYHELQSLFQLLDYGDTLYVTPNQSGKITIRDNTGLIPLQENIIYRAAVLLQEQTQCDLGCDITLNKVLPMGGGLGGGSSNAATALIALNYLWELHLNEETLALMGLQLGADVPIFVKGNSAFAEGIGEKLTPTELPEKYFLVVHPGIHISTARVFNHSALSRDTARIKPEDYCFEHTQNDCQSLVCELYPDIAKSLGWLLEYAPSRMTGTGSCLFSVYETKQSATHTLNRLPKGWSGFVTRGINRSSLQTALRSYKERYKTK